MRRGFLLALMLSTALTPAAFARLPHGIVTPPPVLSASPSPTTINLTWTSPSAATSSGGCGTIAGGPYTSGTAIDMYSGASVTSHDVIVAGLVPSTTYYCRGVGGGTGLATTTTLATPSNTPLTGATFSAGAVASAGQNNGDTYYNDTNAAGTNFVVANDTGGWGHAGNYHMLMGKFISTTPFTGADVNQFPNFNVLGEGPKLFGVRFHNGVLYAIFSSICTGPCPGVPANVFTQLYGSILKSPDNGLTWSNGQAPNSYSAGGSVPTPVVNGVPQYTMFDAASGCSQSAFVTYGTDNGTVLPSIRIDNSDAFIYLLCTSPVAGQTATAYQFNGDDFYLMRMPLADLPSLSTARMQFYIGGPSGNGVDGSLDGAWQSGYAGAVSILHNPGKLSNSQMAFFPNMGRYVIFNWYWPSPGAYNNSTRLTYECAHPWSCTPTPIEGPTSSTPQGFYNATVYGPSALTAMPNGAAATLLVAGNFFDPTYYQLYTMTVSFSQ